MKRTFPVIILLLTFALPSLYPATAHGAELEIEKAKQAVKDYVGPYAFDGEGAEVSGPLTIEEIEEKSMEEIAQCEHCPQVPFGYENDTWVALKKQYQAGGIFFYFRTNNATWNNLAGREGYALVQGDQVIGVIITLMN